MEEALDLILQAYTVLVSTPHKTTREKHLMSNCYLRVYQDGGRDRRKAMEDAKRAATISFSGAEPEKKNTVAKELKPPVFQIPPKQEQPIIPQDQQLSPKKENAVAGDAKKEILTPAKRGRKPKQN